MRILGIPVQDALFLRDLLNLITCVEGATYIDDTAKTMAGLFQKEITIKNQKQSGKLRKNAPISQMLPFSLETHIDAHVTPYGKEDEYPPYSPNWKSSFSHS
jgi:hypothetical protein